MSSHTSVPSEIAAILKAAGGGTPVRPNSPVLPLESAYATATFIDPSDDIIAGQRMKVGTKDYIAPNVVLNATKGEIVIGTGSTIQDDAQVIANPGKASGLSGISIGDNVVIGDDAVIEGPAAIGAKGGAATSIGAGALIDGAIVLPGAFVGALARVGPGVIVPTGFRVLPGANLTNQAQADNPALGKVAKVTSTDTAPAAAAKEITDSEDLAEGYAMLYQGNSAAGGAATAGSIPSAVSATGSTIYFGELNAVLGVSSEPGSTRDSPFEPATATTPTFLTPSNTGSKQLPLAINVSYAYPARVIGSVAITEGADQFEAALGGVSQFGLYEGLTIRTNGDTIRADEGQPIGIGSISSLGKDVSIHSPIGGVQGTTTTTVVTSTTIVATGATTTTSTTTTATSTGAPTATAGTTTATTTGINAAGQATTGTVTTTIATKSSNLGAVAIGKFFNAGNDAVILGSPTALTVIGNGVTVGANAVVIGSTIGSGSLIGNKAYISGSSIPAGSVIPAGAIIINNKVVGFVQW